METGTSIDTQHTERDKTSFAYSRTITKEWGGLDPIIEWCKSECRSDWRWQLIEVSADHRPGCYVFYFDSELDCCAFTLKWD
jgi:hypothetical protein